MSNIRVVVSLWIFVVWAGPLAAQAGELKGVVRDASGKLIQGATILLEPEQEHAYLERRTNSDSLGHFSFPSVAEGTYVIAAKKEKDGFPDTTFSFFGIGQPRPKEIKVAGPITTVVVRVGQPDGVLSGTVEDEFGRPVPGAQYRLCSKENPELLIVSGANRYGQIETLVPGVPIVVQLEPEGFDQWRSESIFVRAGQARHFRIKLRHLPK